MNQSKFISAILFVLLIGHLHAQEWIPEGAKVCYRSHEEFFPDGTFCLKLKITKLQFEGLVKKMGATLHSNNRKYSDDKRWLAWSPDRGSEDPFAAGDGKNERLPKGEMLWDPDPDLSATYVWQSKDSWKFLKYEGGYLYYKELSH